MRVLGWRGISLEVVEGEGVNKVSFGVNDLQNSPKKREVGGVVGD
jgi:hypothetical protein